MGDNSANNTVYLITMHCQSASQKALYPTLARYKSPASARAIDSKCHHSRSTPT